MEKREEIAKRSKRYERHLKVWTIASVVFELMLMLVVFTINLYIFLSDPFSNPTGRLVDKSQVVLVKIVEYTALLTYLLPPIVFSVMSFLIFDRLKEHFREFYDQYRIQLFLATVGLTLPLIIRAVYDLIFLFGESESLRKVF